MKRILKALKAIIIIAKNPWKLNHIINQNNEWEKYVNKKYNVSFLPVIDLNTFVGENVTISPYTFLDGQCSPVDIALLKELAFKINNCKYFEIGTWRGESVSNVASVSAICYTLDLSEKDLLDSFKDANIIASQRLFSKNLKNVVHLSGDSNKFDFESLPLKFDLIFIDGDHHYENILTDTRNVINHLCHNNTIIVWHDYSYNAELIRFETLAAILDSCPQSFRKHLYHVSNTNCAILYRSDASSKEFNKYSIPEQYFSVNLNIKPFKEE